MRIGIDVDGVLVDFCQSYQSLIVRETGRDLFTPENNAANPSDWNWDAVAGYTPEEIGKIWTLITDSSSFWKDLKPLPGIRDALKRVNGHGHDVYYITNRPGKTAKGQTELWLYRHGITVPTVLVAGDKGPIIKALDLEAFIDDRPDTMKKIPKQAPNCRMFVRDMSYNRIELKGVERVATFADFLKELKI